MRTALTAIALLSLVASAARADDAVQVRVMTREHPQLVHLQGPRAVSVALDEGRLLLDGQPVDGPLELPAGRWQVRARDRVHHYLGSLSLSVAGDELALVTAMPLEEYVAQAVASETDPGTPAPALRAQAVVARSYVLSAGRRHPSAAVCDLAHCQVMSGLASSEHLEAARRAARETRGQILVYDGADPIPAPFHAACGGHTADPRTVWGRPIPGVRGVPDPACEPRRWETEMDLEDAERILGRLFHGPAIPIDQVSLERDATGRARSVVDVSTGRRVPADALVRALDRHADWGVVRSAWLDWSVENSSLRLHGRGIGHGVGLCQSGAAARARAGASYTEILQAYFPEARIAQWGRVASR